MHGGLPPGYEDQQKFMCDQCTNVFFNEWSLKLHIKVSSVVSILELLNACTLLLRKLCVCARMKFEIVIFCALMLAQSSNQSQILENTC